MKKGAERGDFAEIAKQDVFEGLRPEIDKLVSEGKYAEAYSHMNEKLYEFASALGKTYDGNLQVLRKEFEGTLPPEVVSLLNPESIEAREKRAAEYAAKLYPEPEKNSSQDKSTPELEGIPAYQEEIRRRLFELSEYVDKTPDDLPDKELILRLSRGIAHAVGTSMWATPERAHKEFLGNLDNALKLIGYNTIKKIHQFELEARAELRGDEPWLRSEVAARKELERLQPWAKNGIGDERQNAEAYMEIIYSRFPNLRMSVSERKENDVRGEYDRE